MAREFLQQDNLQKTALPNLSTKNKVWMYPRASWGETNRIILDENGSQIPQHQKLEKAGTDSIGPDFLSQVLVGPLHAPSKIHVQV